MKTGRLLTAIAASALLVSPSFAGDAALAPGKPAGVHKADLSSPTLLAVGVLVVIGVGVGLVVSQADQGSSTPNQATTVTTTTTG